MAFFQELHGVNKMHVKMHTRILFNDKTVDIKMPIGL